MMAQPITEKPRGLLNVRAAETKFELTRYAPSDDLAFFVERYWIVRWDLRGQPPFVQSIVPFPCVNLAFEQDGAKVYGVVSRKDSQTIAGQGQVFGVKFRPGAFYPFLKSPVSALTDRVVPAFEVFGFELSEKINGLQSAVMASDDDQAKVRLVEPFLRDRLPEQDETVATINAIVDCILAERGITRVDDLVSRFSVSKRTLQRLFHQYVGVSPKWVIQTFRLQEAVEKAGDGPVDWARLALELGYFDQAHFIKDFKAIIGSSPAEYARQAE